MLLLLASLSDNPATPTASAAPAPAAGGAATVLPPGTVCMGSRDYKAPRTYELPVGGKAGEALVIDWLVLGDEEVAGSPAYNMTIRFADGKEMAGRGQMGLQLSSHPITTRDSSPFPVQVDGATRYGSRQVIPLGRPDVPIEKVSIASRIVNQTLCVVASSVGPAPYFAADRTDTTGWYPFSVSRTLPSPIPQANPPQPDVTRRGFVSMGADGHLHYADGSRARFWGINLVGDAGIPEKEEAEAYAATLANMGFDLARIHHIDRVARGVIDGDRGPTTDPFDEARLDRLDWFISKLEAHGIHLWAEIATAREFSAADGVSNPEGAPNGHKLYPMWEPDWEAAYLKWFEQLWGRTNTYTGRRYVDDPGIAVLELSNEHSLLGGWGVGIEGLNPVHLQHLDARWTEWLKARYGSDEALAQAWSGSAHPGLQPGESLSSSIAREPKFMTMADRWPGKRRQDLVDFYYELESNFYKKVADKARSMGFKVPMVPTIQYNRPLLQSLHAPFPIADQHIAYDKGADNLIDGDSLLAHPLYALGQLTIAQAGKATSVSELSHPFPNPYRAEGPWLWTTLALVQDWDLLLWWHLSDTPFSTDPATLPNMNDLRTNPVEFTQMPAAASAFRGGWIPAATGSFPVRLESSALKKQFGTAEIPRPLEIFDLPLVLSRQVRMVFDQAIPEKAGPLVPGVGWWTEPGVLLLDQPQLQVRVGPPDQGLSGGAGIRQNSGLEVSLDRFAAVALVSADGKPLASSRLATLTLSTNGENTGMRWASYGTVVWSPGTAPTILAPARGSIRFAWNGTPVVEALGPDGQPTGKLPVTPVPGRKGWWSLDTSAITTPWMQVRGG